MKTVAAFAWPSQAASCPYTEYVGVSKAKPVPVCPISTMPPSWSIQSSAGVASSGTG